MNKRSVIVTDLSFGDAGKGTTVDYLVRQAASAVVVRHNGGPQAAHNVVTPSGRHHTFSQFGSGSFVPNVRTHLSRFMLINPLNMFPEAAHLQALGVPDIWGRLSVDREAVVITPWQQSGNRLRELARDNGRHGSCGQGLGETVADSLTRPELLLHAGDLGGPQMRSKLLELRSYKYGQLSQELTVPDSEAATREWAVFSNTHLVDVLCEAYTTWSDLVHVVHGSYLDLLAGENELLLFEGSQGVLLDESLGFHPYTTWSKTTSHNAQTLLAELDYNSPVTRLGVLRGYTTRHGPGPFVTEDITLTRAIPDIHNNANSWQRSFRIGHLDLLAHAYAIAATGGVDELVVTGLDRLMRFDERRFAMSYYLNQAAADGNEFFERDNHGMITALRPSFTGGVDRQARLSELLLSCEPQYQSVTASVGGSDKQETLTTEFLRVIEDCLGLPITLASFGPSAADKRALVAC